MNSFIDGEALKLTELLMPWIAILLSLIAAFWLKDFAQNLLVGIKFRMNSAFNEGDKVLLDGNDAIIVKIGLRDTVFGVYSDRGYTWRYVPNTRIPMLKLEKIVGFLRLTSHMQLTHMDGGAMGQIQYKRYTAIKVSGFGFLVIWLMMEIMAFNVTMGLIGLI